MQPISVSQIAAQMYGLPQGQFDDFNFGSEQYKAGLPRGGGVLRPGGGYPGAQAGSGYGFAGGASEADTGSLMGMGGMPFSMGPVGKASWGGGVPASGPSDVYNFGGKSYDMTGVMPERRGAAISNIKIGRPGMYGSQLMPNLPDLSRFTPQLP